MSGVSPRSGLTSYQSIQAQLDQALNDPGVNTILLNINSNGGQVSGCFDLVDHIYNSRGTKPIIAISNESAYSAAYALGSAADKLYVTRTAGVGSVGVIALHADISKKLENDGIKYTAIKAGKHKDDLSPYKSLTPTAKETIQAKVNDTYDLFVNTVARNRGLDPEIIYSTEAKTYDGQKAVDLGLADKVTTYDNVINTYGGNNMELQAKFDELNEKFIKLQTKHGILQEDMANMEKAVPDMIKEAADLGRSQELTRVMAILEKCIAGKKIDLIEDLVKNSNTPEQAAALIMQSKALESEAEQVSSAIKGNTNAQEANILVKNAETRAQEYSRK
jgi:signal peptide peptidase SppA